MALLPNDEGGCAAFDRCEDPAPVGERNTPKKTHHNSLRRRVNSSLSPHGGTGLEGIVGASSVALQVAAGRVSAVAGFPSYEARAQARWLPARSKIAARSAEECSNSGGTTFAPPIAPA